MYTVIEMRRTSLLVSVGPCEIEIPTALIIGLTLYVDIPDALIVDCEREQPLIHWVGYAVTDEEFEVNRNEREAILREQADRFHSWCGCAANDTVKITRVRYTLVRGVLWSSPVDDWSG